MGDSRGRRLPQRHLWDSARGRRRCLFAQRHLEERPVLKLSHASRESERQMTCVWVGGGKAARQLSPPQMSSVNWANCRWQPLTYFTGTCELNYSRLVSWPSWSSSSTSHCHPTTLCISQSTCDCNHASIGELMKVEQFPIHCRQLMDFKLPLHVSFFLLLLIIMATCYERTKLRRMLL